MITVGPFTFHTALRDSDVVKLTKLMAVMDAADKLRNYVAHLGKGGSAAVRAYDAAKAGLDG